MSTPEAENPGDWVEIAWDDAGSPPRITPAGVRAAHAALDRAPAARIVLLRSCFGSFCHGFDLAAVTEAGEPDADAFEAFTDLLDRLARSPAPVIAEVEGRAIGGGVGVAAVADLVLVTAETEFSLPETMLGLVPAMIFPYVEARCGPKRARLLASGYRPLVGEECVRFGLADEIVESPAREARRQAKRFLRMDPEAVAAIRALSHRNAGERIGQRELAAEARNAFAKRLVQPTTRRRIARFLAGEAPWLDDEDAE